MVTPPPHEVVRTHLHERFLHEIPSYKMNKVHKVGEDLQLLMNIQVRTNDGTRKSVSVLVDTGAEANLVRGGLFNDSLMRNAREPLSFVTANGQPLEGASELWNSPCFLNKS